MTIPGLFFGSLIGALVGGLLHLVVGGHPARLLLYVLFGVIGFWVGQITAEIFDWTLFSFGSLHLGVALPICLVVTGFLYWLSLVQTTEKKS
jgi:hypothetical protein